MATKTKTDTVMKVRFVGGSHHNRFHVVDTKLAWVRMLRYGVEPVTRFWPGCGGYGPPALSTNEIELYILRQLDWHGRTTFVEYHLEGHKE